MVPLPELADSGYNSASAAAARTLASPIPEGRPSQKPIALAAEPGLYIVSGMNELHESTVCNSAIICGPSGHPGTFRKLHLWNRSKLSFQPGNLGLPVFDTPIPHLGVVICCNGWFPEVFRHPAPEHFVLAFVPTIAIPTLLAALVGWLSFHQGATPLCATVISPVVPSS